MFRQLGRQPKKVKQKPTTHSITNLITILRAAMTTFKLGTQNSRIEDIKVP